MLVTALCFGGFQIFNLMKFDSYTRFLKSLLYQACMLAEVEGRPLPDPYHIPSSPNSKHSTTGSDRSNLSTPKKVSKNKCALTSTLLRVKTAAVCPFPCFLFGSYRRTKGASQAALWMMTAGMIQETGGRACSSPGPAIEALAKAQRKENWPTLITVSRSSYLLICSIILGETAIV